MKIATTVISTVLMTLTCHAVAEDTLELKTTIIKNNKELPQVLYIVPWQETEKEKIQEETMVLHSLFGNAFDPVTPKDLGQ